MTCEEGLSDLLLSQVIKSCERCPVCSRRKKTSLALKTKGQREESEYSWLTMPSSFSLFYHIFPRSVTFLQTQHKECSGLIILWIFISLSRLPCHSKLKYIGVLFSCSSVSSYTESQLRVEQKNIFPSLQISTYRVTTMSQALCYFFYDV